MLSNTSEDDISLLDQIIRHCYCNSSTQTTKTIIVKPLMIPSLSNDVTSSGTIISPTDILSSTRQEILAWCFSDRGRRNEHEQQQQQQQHQKKRNIFWSLIVAHTASFEAKHQLVELSWIVPKIALILMKCVKNNDCCYNNNKKSFLLLRYLHEKVLEPKLSKIENFLQLLNQKSQNKKKLLKLEAISKTISSRWIGVARSSGLDSLRQFFPSFPSSSSCHSFSTTTTKSSSSSSSKRNQSKEEEEEFELFLWQLSSVIVQSLLSVLIPSRGIFIDRIKILVAQNSVQKHDVEDDEDDYDSDSDDSSSEDDDDSEEESMMLSSTATHATNNTAANNNNKRKIQYHQQQEEKQTVKLIQGFVLPFQLSVESQIVFNRLVRKKLAKTKQQQNNSSVVESLEVNVACFSCSLLSSCSWNEEEEDFTEKLKAFCQKHQISVIFCQRVIEPEIRVALASSSHITGNNSNNNKKEEENLFQEGVICIDRLGITKFPIVLNALKLSTAEHVFHTIPTFCFDENNNNTNTNNNNNNNNLEEEKQQLSVKRKIQRAKIWTEEKTSEKMMMMMSRLWISAADNNENNNNTNTNQQPSITTIQISQKFSLLFQKQFSKSIETIISKCLRNVAQLLIDDIVISSSSSSSSCENSGKCILTEIFSLLLQEFEDDDGNGNELFNDDLKCRQFCVEVLHKLKDEFSFSCISSSAASSSSSPELLNVNEQKEKNSSETLKQQFEMKYPRCHRFVSIRDAILTGFELGAMLCSIE